MWSLSQRQTRGLLPVFALVLALPSAAAAQSHVARSASLEAVLHARGELATLVLRDPAATGSAAASSLRAIELGRAGEVTSLAVAESSWLVAGDRVTADGRRLAFVQRGTRDTAEEITLEIPEANVQTQARLLVQKDQLRGLVWMQGTGSRRLVPWFARFDGERLGGAQPLAELGRGSQTGLTATVLGDGSLLAVWVQYDGEDDEVVFRRFDGQRWSPAQSLSANAVPDVTPSVVATPFGALVAWSRYDGRGYRIVLARLEGGRKTAETVLGVEGSHYPKLSAIEDGSGEAQLLYFDSPADTWHLLALAPEGRVVRSARSEGASRERPAFVDKTDHVLFLRADADDQVARWSETAQPLTWTFEDEP